MSKPTTRLPPIRHYEVLKHLGSGGMADVYLAVNPGLQGRLQRKLAIKRIKEGHVDDESMRALFLDEMSLLGALDHENIVACYDSGEENGVFDLVMEYVEGPTLKNIGRHLAAHGQRMSLSLVLEIARQLLEALVHAHERTDDQGRPLNIVHCDVSPQNVLVNHQGQVKLMDFGISKFAGRFEYTATLALRGKPAYISPEQINKIPVDGRSDLFSVGIMLRELLTGRHPFVPPGQPLTVDQIMELIRQGSFVPLLREAPNFDSDLAAWFDALLEPDPAARPQSARMALRGLVNHPIRPDAKLMLGELGLTTTRSAGRATPNGLRQPGREAQSGPATPSASIAASSGTQDEAASDDPALDLLERERALETGSALRPETGSGPVLRVSRPTTATSSFTLHTRFPRRTWYAAAAVLLLSGGSAAYLLTHQPLAAARSGATSERTAAPLSGSTPPADVLRPNHVREVAPAAIPNSLALSNGLSIDNVPDHNAAPTSQINSPSSRAPLASAASDASVQATVAGDTGPRPATPRTNSKTCDESKSSAKLMIDPWGYIWFRKRPLGRAPQTLECLKPGKYVVEISQREGGPTQKHDIVLQPGRNDIVLQLR